MENIIWMAAGGYLLVGALLVWTTQFSADAEGPMAEMAIFVVSLAYGLSWPARLVRQLFQRTA